VPEDAVAALHALKPAFRAGVSAWRRVGGERAGLAKLLDTMTDAALLYDTRGILSYQNPAALRTMPVGADGDRLREAAQKVAWAVAAVARRGAQGSGRGLAEEPASRELALGAQRWSLRGAVVGEGLLGRDPAVLVTITQRTGRALDDAELAEKFDLTPREIEIARCLAAGLQNKEIGSRLGISTFTARNHVEKVLAKLGVDGRAKVGIVLRGE
jgi:DNA-binding NarL/FixJ family response regulator